MHEARQEYRVVDEGKKENAAFKRASRNQSHACKHAYTDTHVQL